MNDDRNRSDDNTSKELPGANIAGVPVDEPDAGAAEPSGDGGEPYIPKHHAGDGERRDEGIGVPRGGDYIPQPDGTNIAPNGAVIRNPWSQQPEIKPDYEYTDEQQDYDLLIM